MKAVFLSLGGNLQDRSGTLSKARELIQEHCGKVIKTSGLYETEAWGSNSKNKFLNQVIELDTDLNVSELLQKLLEIERMLGRKRGLNKYGDRLIDIDILFYKDLVSNTKQIQIPHPQIQFRRFVLVPLSEIAPDFIHPILKKPVKVLLKNCEDKLDVKIYRKENFPRYICIEGNIGSGKTSLANALKTHLQATFLPEDFKSMRLLPLFYGNPKLYAFSLEFSFLLSRFEQISACFEQEPQRVLSDYSIYKSLCFARVSLKPEEFRLFKKQFDAVIQKIPEPDLIIHLNTSTKNLLNNIGRRGRDFEKRISSDYLVSVQKSYSKTFRSLRHIPQFHLETEVLHKGLEKEHIARVDRYIRDNFGQKSQKPYI